MMPQQGVGTPQGAPHSITTGMPQGTPQGTPQGVTTNIPTGTTQGTRQGTIQGITQGIRQGMGLGTIHGMVCITSTGSMSTNNKNQVQQQLHHYIDGMGSHNTQAPIADRQSS